MTIVGKGRKERKMPIDAEKCQSCHERRALVSVDEWVLQNEREVKRRRHPKEVFMKELAIILSHGLRYGGL
jgi:hypothetical protein